MTKRNQVLRKRKRMDYELPEGYRLETVSQDRFSFTVIVCDDCETLVWNIPGHQNWHRRVGQIAQSAYRADTWNTPLGTPYKPPMNRPFEDL
jgi:hypothetical protein